MSDLISRQAAIDALNKLDVSDGVGISSIACGVQESAIIAIQHLPSAQPEQSDASEFWRKRADYYSDLCMRLITEMGKGVKIESVKISENGIEFIKEQPSAQPERKTGRWLIREGISDAQCSECKMYFKDVYDMDNSDAFCRHCGAKMEGLKVVKDE